jgi:hypothetical protein
MPKIIFVDIDGFLCTDEKGDYEKVSPFYQNIELINRKHDKGEFIIIWTARGRTTGKDYRDLTMKQLSEWGVKYNVVRFDKPFYDEIYDDKSVFVF